MCKLSVLDRNTGYYITVYEKTTTQKCKYKHTMNIFP